MRDSLTQWETFPQIPNIATYVQGNSGFCRKALSGQSNTAQVMSEPCGEKLNWVEFHLAIIINPAFVTTRQKLFIFKVYQASYLKIVLHTKARNSTEKEKDEEKKSNFRVFD